MKASRRLDSKIHKIVFQQNQDICPKYSKDFQDTALLIEMMLLREEVEHFNIGWDLYYESYYCEIIYCDKNQEISIKKIEHTKELAICSVAMDFFERKHNV